MVRPRGVMSVAVSEPRPEWLILPAACLGMLALGVNGTAIMAALPTMRAELGLSATQVGWAINAYLIVSAACIIPGGRASDQAGAGRVSLAGLGLFVIASGIIATAQRPWLLLTGRAVQGLAAALAVPGTLAAIGAAYPGPSRPGAIGLWAGFLMLGFSIGPLIGGALTHYVGWRAIFWASSATMALAASGVLVATGAASPPRARTATSFDWPGFGLLAVFMTALVSALHALASAFAAPLGFAAPTAAAAIALGALLVVERRVSAPLLDSNLFNAAFVRALLVGSIAMSSILCLLLYYNLYAQSSTGLALSPVRAGLSLLPMSGGLLGAAFSAPRQIDRWGPRRALGSAMILTALAAIAIGIGSAGAIWTLLLTGLFGIGIGLAVPYATAPRLALAALPAERAGAGAGLVNACTFLGGSVGVAGGSVAYAAAGLPAVAGLIAVLSLAGFVVCRRMPALGNEARCSEGHERGA